jgi:hypothetical protein
MINDNGQIRLGEWLEIGVAKVAVVQAFGISIHPHSSHVKYGQNMPMIFLAIVASRGRSSINTCAEDIQKIVQKYLSGHLVRKSHKDREAFDPIIHPRMRMITKETTLQLKKTQNISGIENESSERK